MEERYFQEHPDGVGVSAATDSYLAARFAAGAYNLIAAAQAAEQVARRDRDRVLHLAEVR